jgi:hypothetical protein
MEYTTVLLMLNDNISNNTDPTPLVAKGIEKDIDTAKTHLTNHVTREEEVLTLDKSCEYCQIYLRMNRIHA